MRQSEEFTIGVEEEYQIVDAETRELRPRALRILPGARAAVGEQVTPEMYLSQIEIGTPVCRTLAEVRAELTRLRGALEEDGAWEEVSGLVRATLGRGNGAARQRAAYERANSWEGVVDYVLTETLPRPESMGKAQ